MVFVEKPLISQTVQDGNGTIDFEELCILEIKMSGARPRADLIASWCGTGVMIGNPFFEGTLCSVLNTLATLLFGQVTDVCFLSRSHHMTRNLGKL